MIHKMQTDFNIDELKEETIRFLNLFGNEIILGEVLQSIVKKGSGESKFNNLLKATGYENNFQGFFSELSRKLSKAQGNLVDIGGIVLPYHFLLFILEIIMPGEGFINIKTVKELEEITGRTIPETEKEDLQQVIDKYPVRLSHHVLRQMRLSKAISYQYLPFVDELNKEGLVNTWVGQFHQGPLEQMYQNRPIFVLNMGCPVYCRFCFRKHKECRNQPSPTVNDIKEAFKHIQKQPKIKEMLLTGGDPFMNQATIMAAVDEALNVDHLKTLRIATRSISYYPHLFYQNNKFWLEYLKRTQIKLQQKGKKLEVATHFLHPDEISFDSLNIISELVSNGIPVYAQTPFLKDCNDKGPELVELYHKLRGAGAEIHYIFMPCTPLQGNRRYVSTISSGLKVARYLRANLSDRALPKMCTATVIGKIDWFTSGWAVEKYNENFIWIRTPYNVDYFKEFSPNFKLESFDPIKVRENKEGNIETTFMAKIGDEKLFIGSKETTENNEIDFNPEKLKELQEKVLTDQRKFFSIVPAPAGMLRQHKTIVEIDLNAELDFAYINNDKKIKEVVISAKEDPINNFSRLEEVVKKLSEIEHISSIRIRSLKFNYSPEEFGFVIINKLGEFNKLSLVNPKRIEIETQFLHSSEAKEEHKELVRSFGKKGITVYNNTPLLNGINDDKKEFEKIANHLRDAGIEFNVAYLEEISLNNFINVASHLRRHGSGREIPRYFLRTELGEINFGIDTEFFRKDGKVFAKLLAYSADNLKEIDPNLSWSEFVEGHPIVEVNGLTFEEDFMLDS